MKLGLVLTNLLRVLAVVNIPGVLPEQFTKINDLLAKKQSWYL